MISVGACSNRLNAVVFLCLGLVDLLAAVMSFQTKHEFPMICVFGFLPLFLRGICNTMSMLELVNAAIDPFIMESMDVCGVIV